MPKNYETCISLDDPIFYNDPEWNINYEKYILTEYFMRRFKHLINWSTIAKTQKLSVSFMREMIDYLPLHIIIRFQTFDDDFLSDLASTQPENLDWGLISTKKLTDAFIKQHIDYLHLDSIVESSNLSDDIKVYINQYIVNQLIELDISEPLESAKFEK